MVSKKQRGEHKWLKRIAVAIVAAIVTTLFTRRKALAPSPAQFDFQLPPAPDRAASPQEPTPEPAPTEHIEPALDLTSEGSDTVTHEGEEGAVDLSDVGLDIDVDLELEGENAPDLTAEGLDTAEITPAAALASGEGYVRMNGDEHDCPEGFPIKGNAKSHIYHLPGESSYQATIPEICFASEEAAQAMDYRPRKH